MSIKKYIMEDEFKITILKDKIDIINYLEIDSFDEEKIIIRHEDGAVVLTGSSLSITKLLDKEILISGCIDRVEFR